MFGEFGGKFVFISDGIYKSVVNNLLVRFDYYTNQTTFFMFNASSPRDIYFRNLYNNLNAQDYDVNEENTHKFSIPYIISLPSTDANVYEQYEPNYVYDKFLYINPIISIESETTEFGEFNVIISYPEIDMRKIEKIIDKLLLNLCLSPSYVISDYSHTVINGICNAEIENGKFTLPELIFEIYVQTRELFE